MGHDFHWNTNVYGSVFLVPSYFLLSCMGIRNRVSGYTVLIISDIDNS